jgi:hypothetical protein
MAPETKTLDRIIVFSPDLTLAYYIFIFLIFVRCHFAPKRVKVKAPVDFYLFT